MIDYGIKKTNPGKNRFQNPQKRTQRNHPSKLDSSPIATILSKHVEKHFPEIIAESQVITIPLKRAILLIQLFF